MSNLRTVILLAALAALIGFAVGSYTPEAAAQAARPGFIQPGSCYRIAFPIDSPPNYKVLEIQDGGWIRAEVDAGPASAERASMWVNTAQIISMREVRCSQ